MHVRTFNTFHRYTTHTHTHTYAYIHTYICVPAYTYTQRDTIFTGLCCLKTDEIFEWRIQILVSWIRFCFSLLSSESDNFLNECPRNSKNRVFHPPYLWLNFSWSSFACMRRLRTSGICAPRPSTHNVLLKFNSYFLLKVFKIRVKECRISSSNQKPSLLRLVNGQPPISPPNKSQ